VAPAGLPQEVLLPGTISGIDLGLDLMLIGVKSSADGRKKGVAMKSGSEKRR
jgi:hypothetical protein